MALNLNIDLNLNLDLNLNVNLALFVAVNFLSPHYICKTNPSNKSEQRI